MDKEKITEKMKLVFGEDGVTLMDEEEMMPMDLDYELNTAESGSVSVVTDEICGYLEALIISVDKVCNIKIFLDEFPSIMIYEKPDFDGTFYLPIRITPVSHSANVFNFSAQRFLLNHDKLVIEINGQKQTGARIKIRYACM